MACGKRLNKRVYPPTFMSMSFGVDACLAVNRRGTTRHAVRKANDGEARKLDCLINERWAERIFVTEEHDAGNLRPVNDRWSSMRRRRRQRRRRRRCQWRWRKRRRITGYDDDNITTTKMAIAVNGKLMAVDTQIDGEENTDGDYRHHIYYWSHNGFRRMTTKPSCWCWI